LNIFVARCTGLSTDPYDALIEGTYTDRYSNSCVAMIHEFYPKVAKLSGSRQLEERVEKLIPKVFEFTQFLVNQLKIEDVGAYYPLSSQQKDYKQCGQAEKE
jgi:hypothetical protein